MMILTRLLPSCPPLRSRPRLIRLAEDAGLMVIVATWSAVLITLVNGRPNDLSTQMADAYCIGLVALAIIDGVRLGLLDTPQRRRRWLLPFLALVVVTAPVAHFCGEFLSSVIRGVAHPSLAHYPDGRGDMNMILFTLLAICAIWLMVLNRERLERMKFERSEARARAEATERHALQVQLRLLQAQIEPHMLFNTLANLQGLIAIDAQAASRMLDHLIQYLRATLSATRADTVTLEQEFAAAEAYLGLMAVRMGARLAYRCVLPPGLRTARLPAMLLQPLVENAVIHGLEPKIDGGSVTLEARDTGGRLEIRVRDTGLGLDEGAAGPKGSGIGIATTRERLQALYGERAALVLEAAEPNGVLAVLTLPLAPEEA